MRLSWNSAEQFARNSEFKCFSRGQIWPKSLFLLYRENGCHFCWRQHHAIRSKIWSSIKKVWWVFFVGCQNLAKIVLDFFLHIIFGFFTRIHYILVPQLLIHRKGSIWACSLEVSSKYNSTFSGYIDFNKFGQKDQICIFMAKLIVMGYSMWDVNMGEVFR